MATGGTIQGNTFTFGAGAGSGGGGLFGPGGLGSGGMFGTSGPAASGPAGSSGPAATDPANKINFLVITLGEKLKLQTVVRGGVKVVSGPGECKILGKVEGIVMDKLQPDAVVPEIALSPTECKIMGDWSAIFVQCDMIAVNLIGVGAPAHEALEPLQKKARTEK